MKKIFIDGQAGTTGLQIQQKLEKRTDIELLNIPKELRKDNSTKKQFMLDADLVILCLHDEAARESVALIDSLPKEKQPRILDASTAHRVHEDWVYGFAELDQLQYKHIAQAQRVSNPGCYATGAIAALAPLIKAQIIPSHFPITLPAISGYSGGGRTMIEAYENHQASAYEAYALTLNHKHIPEIMRYTGLTHRPLFMPAVSNFAQGMLVSVPIHLDQLPQTTTSQDIENALREHYQSIQTQIPPPAWISVHKGNTQGAVSALSVNNTNYLQLHVFGNDAFKHCVVVAQLDNLGKGASGAAVQNLQIMLGLAHHD